LALTQTEASSSGATYQVVLNDGYDVTQSMGTKQPMLWDQFASMYGSYIVTAVDYRITFFQVTVASGPAPPVWVSFVPSMSSSLPSSTLDNVTNYPQSHIMFVAAEAEASYGKPVSVVGHVDITKFLGLRNVDELLAANSVPVTSDPNRYVYGYITVNTNSITCAFKFMVEFNLHIRFHSPILVADATNQVQLKQVFSEPPFETVKSTESVKSMLLEPTPKRAETPRRTIH